MTKDGNKPTTNNKFVKSGDRNRTPNKDRNNSNPNAKSGGNSGNGGNKRNFSNKKPSGQKSFGRGNRPASISGSERTSPVAVQADLRHLEKSPVFCAIDTARINDAQKIIDSVKEHIGGIKLGLEFFTASGGFGVKKLSESKLPIFLDLKFHDIPNTVAKAVEAACHLNPYMMTIHLSGGAEMIKAAVKAASASKSTNKPLIIGVSVLTSMDEENISQVGVSGKIADQVLRLAEIGVKNGINGLVCSAHEIEIIRKNFGNDIKIVVPGIRPAGFGGNDQKRVQTPADAMKLGADYLVIGRAITSAPDPKTVARIIATGLTNI